MRIRGRIRSRGPQGSPPIPGPVEIFGSSLELYLRADLGITIATGVSQWDDQSGKGRHCTQATGPAQPTVVSNWKGGRPALDFNPAGSQQLTNASGAILANGAAYSLWIIGAKDRDPDSVEYNDQLFRIVGTAFHKHLVMLIGGVHYIAGTNAVDSALVAQTYGCGTNPFWAEWIEPGNLNSDVISFRINGVTKTPNTQLNDLSAVTGYRVGGSSSSFLDGKISGVILASGVATTQQRAQMVAFIRNFWGFAA